MNLEFRCFRRKQSYYEDERFFVFGREMERSNIDWRGSEVVEVISIEKDGILVPLLARPKSDGECIIAGLWA
jgi:hypothetical protein